MPLVATAGSRRIESWSLSEEEWIGLKAAYRTQELTMVCGHGAIPKTSRRGLQFFAHKAGADCPLHEGGPESAEHLRTKELVAQSARALGWTATIEHPAVDRSWIADVLLVKGGRRLVVEAQWSAQSDAEFERRRSRYEADGLQVLWLLGPKNHGRTGRFNSRLLGGTTDGLTIRLPAGHMGSLIDTDLSEGMSHVLRGDFAPVFEARVTGLHLETFMAVCWFAECKMWMTRWFIEGADFESRCGQVGDVWQRGYVPYLRNRVERTVQDTVRMNPKLRQMPPLTVYAWRKTKPVPYGYMAQTCPHCHRVQGDFDSSPNRSRESITLDYRGPFAFNAEALRTSHLCIDRGRGLCITNGDTAVASFPHPER